MTLSPMNLHSQRRFKKNLKQPWKTTFKPARPLAKSLSDHFADFLMCVLRQLSTGPRRYAQLSKEFR